MTELVVHQLSADSFILKDGWRSSRLEMLDSVDAAPLCYGIKRDR